MVFGDRSLLCVVRRVLFVVCRLLLVLGCLRFVGCRVFGCCLLVVVCRLLSAACA